MDELRFEELLMDAKCLATISRGAVSGSLAIVAHICNFIKDVEGCTDIDDISKVRVINCMGAICNFLTRAMDAKYGISAAYGKDLRGDDLKEAKKELYTTVIRCFTQDNANLGISHHEYDLEMVTKIKMELISLGQEIRKLKRNISLYKVVKSNVTEDVMAYKQINETYTDEEKHILKINRQRAIGNVQSMIRQNHISTSRNVTKLHGKNAAIEKAIEQKKAEIENYSDMLMALVKTYMNADPPAQLSEDTIDNQSLRKAILADETLKLVRFNAERKQHLISASEVSVEVQPRAPEMVENETNGLDSQGAPSQVNHPVKRKDASSPDSQKAQTNKPRRITTGVEPEEIRTELERLEPTMELVHEVAQSTNKRAKSGDQMADFETENGIEDDVSTDGSWNYEAASGRDARGEIQVSTTTRAEDVQQEIQPEIKANDVEEAPTKNPLVEKEEPIVNIERSEAIKSHTLEEGEEAELKIQHPDIIDDSQSSQHDHIYNIPLRTESEIKDIILRIKTSMDNELKDIEPSDVTKVYLHCDQTSKLDNIEKLISGIDLNISNQTTIVSTSDINITEGRSHSIGHDANNSKDVDTSSIGSEQVDLSLYQEFDIYDDASHQSDNETIREREIEEPKQDSITNSSIKFVIPEINETDIPIQQIGNITEKIGTQLDCQNPGNSTIYGDSNNQDERQTTVCTADTTGTVIMELSAHIEPTESGSSENLTKSDKPINIDVEMSLCCPTLDQNKGDTMKALLPITKPTEMPLLIIDEIKTPNFVHEFITLPIMTLCPVEIEDPVRLHTTIPNVEVGKESMEQGEYAEKIPRKIECSIPDSPIELSSPAGNVWEEIRNIKYEMSVIKRMISGIESHLGSYIPFSMKLSATTKRSDRPIKAETLLDAVTLDTNTTAKEHQATEESIPQSINATNGIINTSEDLNSTLDRVSNVFMEGITQIEAANGDSFESNETTQGENEEETQNNTSDVAQQPLCRQHASEFKLARGVTQEIGDDIPNVFGQDETAEDEAVITDMIVQESDTSMPQPANTTPSTILKDISAVPIVQDVVQTKTLYEHPGTSTTEEGKEIESTGVNEDITLEYISCDEDLAEIEIETYDSYRERMWETVDDTEMPKEVAVNEDISTALDTNDTINTLIKPNDEPLSCVKAVNDAQNGTTKVDQELHVPLVPSKGDTMEQIHTQTIELDSKDDSRDMAENAEIHSSEGDAITPRSEAQVNNALDLEINETQSYPLEMTNEKRDRVETHDKLEVEVNKGYGSQERDIDYHDISQEILKELESIHAIIMNDRDSSISTGSVLTEDPSQSSIRSESMEASNYGNFMGDQTPTRSYIAKMHEGNAQYDRNSDMERQHKYEFSGEQDTKLIMDANAPAKTSGGIDLDSARIYFGMFSQFPITSVSVKEETISKQYEDFQMFKAFLRASEDINTSNGKRRDATRINDPSTLAGHFNRMNCPKTPIFGRETY
ncbi:hypothetical protein X943_002608 [Babesia divergens]|uniref:Uncharacterized protein n=1 Tax=Babesia divergens TaxID=32595 RepID=A0AAD9GI61_BABDI|nr:hypothetical protein X943_002608 [Babesia divergens]